VYILHGEFDRGVFKDSRGDCEMCLLGICMLVHLLSPSYTFLHLLHHPHKQPLSKQDKFYLGHPSTAEYATQFKNIGTLERWGIEFLKDGLSIGGIHFGKVGRGIKKLVFGGKTSTGDEL